MGFVGAVRRHAFRYAVVAVVLGLVAATGLWWLSSRPGDRQFTAYFARAIGVYPGNDVRVLGVKVGSVESVTPRAADVQVVLSVSGDVAVPSGARAVVVAPSLVADRYVQLTPVYQGGPVLADGAVIPRERTVTPAEIDQLYQSLDQLSTALGPKGANSGGALTDVLDTAAKNLDGTGETINQTLHDLSSLSKTLSDNSGDLFSTVDNLQKFTTTLARSDGQFRELTGRLSDASGFLAGQKDQLAAALSTLSGALDRVRGFIQDNRSGIKSNVDNLAAVTQVLSDQRASLAEILDVAPLALNNLVNAYNETSGTLDARLDINELTSPPLVTVCKLVRQSTPKQLPATLADACDRLAPILNGVVPLPSGAQVLNGLQTGNLPLPLVTARGAR
ncbi:MCE family protein [Amycolatopsis sp. NPDC049253]|uniref:MCE family protein n=1 Tax=Amycolatopsis sp. NPDC049253 TaxID=3155274 RepID=UPI00342C0DDF